MTSLHFEGKLSADEAAELAVIRAETGRKVELCRRNPPQWCRRDPLLVWLVPRAYGLGADARIGMAEPARSEVFEVFEVDPARFPALAARIERSGAEDEEALRADLDEENRERAAESQPRALNSRRTDAANALHDADAHLRGLLARWANPDDTDPSLSDAISAAKKARGEAQRALDEAQEEWSAAVTAERIEAEDAARAEATQ